MIELEFTSTAMPRIEIFKRTLDSFVANLKGVSWGHSILYLNVDPLDTETRAELVRAASEIFGTCHVRLPDKANAADACKWVWSMTKGPLVFHLEDDWILRYEVQIHDLICCLRTPQIQQVVLRNVGNVYLYTGDGKRKLYSCPTDMPALTPSLFNGDFLREAAKQLNSHENPEHQMNELFKGKMQSVIIPDESVVSDIGRSWMIANGYVRGLTKHKKDFVSWGRLGEQER